MTRFVFPKLVLRLVGWLVFVLLGATTLHAQPPATSIAPSVLGGESAAPNTSSGGNLGIDLRSLGLPSIEKITHYQPKLHLEVLTGDGVRIGQFGPEIRYFVPLAQIPKVLQNAVLAVEDIRFYEHSGVDPKGIARAVFSLITGGKRQGASTITQQVVRNLVLSREISVERKSKEALLALQVEQILSKQRILEIYLNEIFLGHRSYGFAAASQLYFGKPLDKLTLAEAALLAGIPQNPSYANPITNLNRAIVRQHHVLQRMQAAGFITQEELKEAQAQPLAVLEKGGFVTPALSIAPHVAELARKTAVDKLGETQAYTNGVRVTTALNSAWQISANHAVRQGIVEWGKRAGVLDKKIKYDALAVNNNQKYIKSVQNDFKNVPNPKEAPHQILGTSEQQFSETDKLLDLLLEKSPQAALISVEPQTGRIRSLVGSTDFIKQPQNHALYAQRQSGSVIKPFLYSAALEHGIMPVTVVEDSPYTTASGYTPENYANQYQGSISISQAMAKSSNVASVRTLEHIGLPAALSWLNRFGIDSNKQPANLTLALGAGTSTPLQMVLAYAVFANRGWYNEPTLIERIVDNKGKIWYEATPSKPLAPDVRAIPERNAWLMQRMLSEVIKTGTGVRMKTFFKREDIYGKTGTTSNNFDAWFAGYNPRLATVVWLGHETPKSMGNSETGSSLALPIWAQFMGRVLNGQSVVAEPLPSLDLTNIGGDWVYNEWLQTGVLQLGVPATQPTLDPITGGHQ